MEQKPQRVSSLQALCRILSPTFDRNTILDEIRDKKLNWLTIVEIANENFLTSALHVMLREKDLLQFIDDDKLTAYLNEIYTINLKRNLEIVEQSKELAYTLEKGRLKALFLKGSASLLLQEYRDIGMRFLSDIDFYIKKEDIDKTLSLLKSIGYVRDPKRTYDYDAIHHHYTPMVNKKWQTFIEPHIAILHHNRDLLHPNEDQYSESPFDKKIYTFNPTDRFLHAYLHADFDHRRYWKRELDLRQLYEMANLIIHYSDQINWNSVRSTVEDLQIWNPFNDQMEFIENLFNVTVPITRPNIRSKLYALSVRSKFKYKEEEIYKKSSRVYKWLRRVF